MDFDYVFAALLCVKLVNILGNDCLELSCFFELCKLVVSYVRFNIGMTKIFSVKFKEFFGMFIEKSAAYDFF